MSNLILPIEEEYFNINPCNFCGIESYLIVPQNDAKWNKTNLHLRSIIVDKSGKVLSSGFPKFFNFKEKEECYPSPNNFNDWKLEEKIDGSLLIADWVNEQFSMRTRGTSSYKTQENAEDFELLFKKHPKVVEFLKKNSHLSLLFEIVTPNNVIVIRPREIEFYFIGAFNKNGMTIVSSSDSTEIWRKIGPIPTPQTYEFSNTQSLIEINNFIKDWKGKEGVVLSYNNGQNRIKLKSAWYCWIHKIKSQLNSTNNLIEYYIDKEMPSLENFYKKIEEEFDYEIARQIKPEIESVCKAGEEVCVIISKMNEFVSTIRGFDTRKKQAECILANYGKSQRSSFVFSLLDNKQLDKNQLTKLINQVMQTYVQ